jgi:hypothetical protein
MDKDIHEAISVASGYGIAGLALQFANVSDLQSTLGLLHRKEPSHLPRRSNSSNLK